MPAAVSVLLVGFVHEPKRSQTHEHPPATGPLPRHYWRVVGLLTLFGVVNFSDALLILRAKDLGLGFYGVVGAYALYNLSYSLLASPAGRLSDPIPRRQVFAAGLGVFAVAYLGLGLASSGAWVWVLLPLYGAYTR